MVSDSVQSDSKCSFSRDFSFTRGRGKPLKCENRSHIEGRTQFGQLKNLSNAAVPLRIGHILNPLQTSIYGTCWQNQSQLIKMKT